MRAAATNHERTTMDALTDTSPMPFGKYHGTPLQDVPASYLLWLWDNGIWQEKHKPLHAYIRESWSALLQDCKDYIPQHKP